MHARLSKFVAKTTTIDNRHVHKVPRSWSNTELKAISHHFRGDVCNVSAWEDRDKEGSRYREYFRNATSYHITNFEPEMRGMSGIDGEIYLDLETTLPDTLVRRFDVVFNHTTLEHVYNFRLAFENICKMSRDTVILVVPFMQQVHVIPSATNPYSDYWRFTPHAIERMFEDCGFTVAYMSFNNHKRASVYVFCVATRQPEKWRKVFPMTYSHVDDTMNNRHKQPWAGANSLRKPAVVEIFQSIQGILKAVVTKTRLKLRSSA